MTNKERLLADLRNLSLDRQAVRLMQDDLAQLASDQSDEELPAEQREALLREAARLRSCLTATANHVARLERLLSFLTPEEQTVITRTLIEPQPGAVLDLTAALSCEASSVYRIRARAVTKLVRLRYGVAED